MSEELLKIGKLADATIAGGESRIEPLDSNVFDNLLNFNTQRYDEEGDGILNDFHKFEPVRTEVKIGRKHPCPCGSGKKYKKCCGKA